MVESRENRLEASAQLHSAALEDRMKFPRGCSERFARTRGVLLECMAEQPARLEANYLAKVEKIKAGRERRERDLEWNAQGQREKNAEKHSAVRGHQAEQAAAVSKRARQLAKGADPFQDHWQRRQDKLR